MVSEINSETTVATCKCVNVGVLRVTTENSKPSLILFQAIISKKIEVIKLLLEDKTLINSPVQTSGPLAGYTPLHVACMEKSNNEEAKLVKMLIDEYHADVNIVAEDGTQPLLLACIYRNRYFVELLIKAGANIEAKISQDIFSKYEKDKVWCSDFGDKLTLVTYCTLYNSSELAWILIHHHVNLNIRGCKNKTLLMYALERNQDSLAESIVISMKNNEEYLNARDDDGYCAVHYILHPKKYGEFRYDGEQFYFDGEKLYELLYQPGSAQQIYKTINGDPDTLLLNMAAYRSSATILKYALPYYENIKESKALYLATLPFDDPQKSFRLIPTMNEQEQWELLDKYRKESLKLILQDLTNRLTFGLPVPEEEKNLFDKLVATDKDVREIVHNYQQNYINGRLKSRVVKCNERSISYYDFILRCVDDKKLQLLVRDKIFWRAYLHFTSNEVHDHYFNKFCSIRVERAVDRVRLLEKLKTVKQLRNAITLPYECILDIIEFLNNNDLQIFINSFLTI